MFSDIGSFIYISGKVLGVKQGNVIVSPRNNSKWTYTLEFNFGNKNIRYIGSKKDFDRVGDAKQAMREDFAWQLKHHGLLTD